jgi:hypothetical protein
MSLRDYPRTRAWWAQVQARPAFARAKIEPVKFA